VTADLLDRCKLFGELTFDPVEKVWRDSAGMSVENFGNADNLMIDNSLTEHGGYPIVRHKALPGQTFEDLTGFKACLRLAAEAISKTA